MEERLDLFVVGEVDVDVRVEVDGFVVVFVWDVDVVVVVVVVVVVGVIVGVDVDVVTVVVLEAVEGENVAAGDVEGDVSETVLLVFGVVVDVLPDVDKSVDVVDPDVCEEFVVDVVVVEKVQVKFIKKTNTKPYSKIPLILLNSLTATTQAMPRGVAVKGWPGNLRVEPYIGAVRVLVQVVDTRHA